MASTSSPSPPLVFPQSGNRRSVGPFCSRVVRPAAEPPGEDRGQLSAPAPWEVERRHVPHGTEPCVLGSRGDQSEASCSTTRVKKPSTVDSATRCITARLIVAPRRPAGGV